MRYILFLVACMGSLTVKCCDTLFVEDPKDVRYLRYLDTLQGYEIGYSVASNIADTLRAITGNSSLDAYFLHRYNKAGNEQSDGYFYDFIENAQVEVGRVNKTFKGIKNDTIIPWQYVEAQYKRLDAIKIQPLGILQGAELPNVYVYGYPSVTVIYRKMKRYTVVDPAIKFFKKDDGKTRVSYILKYYYSREGNGHEKIDSIEKLDPVTFKHVSF